MPIAGTGPDLPPAPLTPFAPGFSAIGRGFSFRSRLLQALGGGGAAGAAGGGPGDIAAVGAEDFELHRGDAVLADTIPGDVLPFTGGPLLPLAGGGILLILAAQIALKVLKP